MAVYTNLSESDINELLSIFDLSKLRNFQGASSGIENTTYFLALVDGLQLVLTLFENITRDELPFYITLTRGLNAAGMPVPCPLQKFDGFSIHEILDKPALLFPLVQGSHLDQPNLEEIDQMGSTLAKIHLQCLALSYEHVNPHGLEWMQQTLMFTESSLLLGDKTLIEQQIQVRSKLESLKLPRAVIHADLFRDNVLFRDGKVVGIIDFYGAGTDCLILDIAIAVNDWCLNAEDLVDEEKRIIFLRAYEHERKLSALERIHLLEALQLAATCFWLSRLKGQIRARQGSNQATKNPDSCKKLLLQHMGRQRAAETSG
jgi:homoserine kinase type II|tara:strand:+ start:288 stop:1238 length:951 start_codon:yes stop_codon:yes gene_type:complete